MENTKRKPWEAFSGDQRKPWEIFTGSQLKFIAAALMLLDHAHQMFIDQAPLWFNDLGRLVAPIFLFTLAEGFHYTRSKGKYMLRLFLGSAFMIVASALIQEALPSQTIVLSNNIFATMLTAAVYMLGVDLVKASRRDHCGKKLFLAIWLFLAPLLVTAAAFFAISNDNLIRNNSILLVIALHVFSAIPNLLLVEGGVILVALALLFYIFRGKPLLQTAALLLASVPSWIQGGNQGLMALAGIFILMYNGQKGKGNKWFFYIFYPAHIYILYILSMLLIGK
jgi:hypothetical protein